MAYNTESFTNKAKIKHSGKYSYSSVVYAHSLEKVIITCSIHGDFKQTPAEHLRGQGCAKCTSKRGKDSTESFIQKAQAIHKNKYSYEKVKYKSAKEKVVIICREHGDFEQRPQNHLQEQGCPKCGYEIYRKRSDYIKKSKGRVCTFYTLKCFNENEEFYKIGITIKPIKYRYSGTERMPYKYEIVSETYGEAGEIWDLELQEKRKLKEFNYKPKIKFAGAKTECFTKYKINNNDQ